MSDLSVTFASLALDSPVVAEVRGRDLTTEGLRRLAKTGAAAVTLPPLDPTLLLARQAPSEVTANNRTDGAIRDIDATIERLNNDEYLDRLGELSAASIVPLVAPLAGPRQGRWARRAAELVEAGASIVELRPFDDTAATRPRRADAIERAAIRVVAQVADRIAAPVVVRVPPFAGGLQAIVQALGDAGAKGVVVSPPDWLSAVRVDRRTVVTDITDERLAQAALWSGVSVARVLYRRVAPHIAVVVPPKPEDAPIAALLAGATACFVPVADAANRSLAEIGACVEYTRQWFDRRRVKSLFDVRGYLSESRLSSSIETG